MFLKMMGGGAVLACGVLTAAGLHSPPPVGCPGGRLAAVLCAAEVAAPAEKDKLPLPSAWGKKEGEVRLEFDDETALKIAPHGDATVIAISCNYTLENRTLVKAKVAGFAGTNEEAKQKLANILPVGTEFSFQWTATGDSARLEDVKGEKTATLKAHIEGGYEKK